jgi:DNA-binding MarR family transcriptional regulator
MSSDRPGRAALFAALKGELRKICAHAVLFSQAVAERLGMHPTDLECLGIIAEMGPITPGRLAGLTGLTTGAITGLVDRLERAGFARRVPNPHDRRSVIVEPLTEQAMREIGPIFASMTRAMDALAARYSDEELAVILDFATRANARTLEEIAKLRGTMPPAGQPARAPVNSRPRPSR